MTSRSEPQAKVLAEPNRLSIGCALHELECFERVGLSIERGGRLVFRISAPIRVGGVFFLKPGRVRKHDLQQVGGSFSAVNGTAEPVAHKPGQIAGMIYMGMREHYPIDRARRDRQRIPVSQP